jgi:hypothetical protein
MRRRKKRGLMRHLPRKNSAEMSRLFLVALLLLCTACSRTLDEQRVRETVEAMRQAIVEHSPRAFLAHVSDDFIGNDATIDKAALGNLLRVEVLRNDQVGVMLGPIDVELDGDRATVRVAATFTGGAGGLLPERGSVYSITSGWKRNGSDWVCISAKWEQRL